MRVLILLALMLAGCASGPLYADLMAQANQRTEAAIQDCRVRRLAGELSGYSAALRCSAPRIRQAYAEIGYLYMDLIELRIAYAAALTERVDRGEMSETEMNAREGELYSWIVAEIQRRTYMAQHAQADAMAATGAMLQGIAVWSQSLQPPPRPQPRTPIICSPFGNSIICR